MNKKVLVVGGSGFMGSHTADELSLRGYDVTIYDCVSSKHLSNGQEMIVADLMDEKKMEEAIKDTDIIYYFAGVADIGEAKLNPYNTIHLNVMGVTSVLNIAVKYNISRFVYASTMYVYSVHGSFYRASKQAAETIIEAYHQQYNLSFTLLRYGSLYGPRSQSWNGMKKFAEEIIKHNHIYYGGNGNEVREYIHIYDAARLSVDVLDEKHKDCAITITGQQIIKVKDLFSMLFEISGKEPVINYHEDDNAKDHYGNTPYRYTPKSAKKLVPMEFVDLGQGLLNLIEEIDLDLSSND